MYALIQKTDNKILRVSENFTSLSQEKPFYWTECPESCNTLWTFDGIESFSPPPYVKPDFEERKRRDYQNESDPIFFKWQRGEATQQEWLDKIAEIKARYLEGE